MQINLRKWWFRMTKRLQPFLGAWMIEHRNWFKAWSISWKSRKSKKERWSQEWWNLIWMELISLCRTQAKKWPRATWRKRQRVLVSCWKRAGRVNTAFSTCRSSNSNMQRIQPSFTPKFRSTPWLMLLLIKILLKEELTGHCSEE